jgi:arabinan endo-1,5-alpha-L-arabinosidase
MRRALANTCTVALAGALASALMTSAAPAREQRSKVTHLPIGGDIVGIHDPVIIRERDTYYIYSTNGDAPPATIRIRTSKDLIHWTARGHVFDKLPEWALALIPGKGGAWAPDIARVNGPVNARYLLYYSVSTFGSNRSAIGLATNETLDPSAPNYRWRDEGVVLATTAESDFNAIDPNHVIDREGRHWLSLGSYWTGIKLFELNPATGKLLKPDATPHSLARRRAPVGAGTPVEAPFIVTRPDHYYLFASYDYCCKGVHSTYYVVVGRAKEITGPYVGEDGTRLMDGEGTMFIPVFDEGGRYRGQGHNGYLHDEDGRDYVVYHAYDREIEGKSTLRIAPITWGKDGWPKLQRSAELK